MDLQFHILIGYSAVRTATVWFLLRTANTRKATFDVYQTNPTGLTREFLFHQTLDPGYL